MGADGGSIPRRDEMVKTKERNSNPRKHFDPTLNLHTLWCLCALSKEPFHVPLVSCALGKLYNKEAILQYLLHKKTRAMSMVNQKKKTTKKKRKRNENPMDFVAHTHEQQEEPLLPLTQGGREADLICGHIQSLKDVVELKLTLNPLFTTKLPTSLSTSKDHPIQMGGRTSSSSFMAPFLCPISQLELNGKHPCSYLRPCGHVMADLVWKEMGRRDKKIKKRNKTEGTTTEPTTVEEESQECPVCGQPWVQRVSLYPQHSP